MAEHEKTGEKVKKAADKAVTLAQKNKGALAGAAVGTVLLPGVGTVVGGLVGSLWDR